MIKQYFSISVCVIVSPILLNDAHTEFNNLMGTIQFNISIIFIQVTLLTPFRLFIIQMKIILLSFLGFRFRYVLVIPNILLYQVKTFCRNRIICIYKNYCKRFFFNFYNVRFNSSIIYVQEAVLQTLEDCQGTPSVCQTRLPQVLR